MRKDGVGSYTQVCSGYTCKNGPDQMRDWVCEFLGEEGSDLC